MDEVLQCEPGRVVTLEADNATVRKTFTGPDLIAERYAAEREFDHLSRYRTALSTYALATCPKAIEVNLIGPPFVRMERAVGAPLTSHLAGVLLTERQFDQLAAVIVDALRIYVLTFSEPYYDLHLRNMAVEVPSGLVTFFDFGVPDIFDPVVVKSLNDLPPLDVSLGNLLGSTAFEAARPKTLHCRLRHQQSVRLVEKVLRLSRRIDIDNQPAVDLEVIHWTAVAALRASTTRRGGLLRTVWYGSAARFIAQPERLLGKLITRAR
ncbi:hypothetical protein FHX44_114926 [Pseudonocardia hierapolitana]|uniref:Aminoglycoside phosphotransferase domain-containing protein n=2 Tax=Pseudonocardia hierapolitana TaxID=1128676 RepID=A0A561SVW2_9PSEU|nr:hypothetical protein FHX44_114926 [Pseudonocardia hierapolitana]